MRVLLKPNRQDPRITDELVTCVARKAGGLVLVDLKGRHFAVDRARLRAAHDRNRPLSDAELDALPWLGKGRDPAGQTNLLEAE